MRTGAADTEWLAVAGPAFAAMMVPSYGTDPPGYAHAATYRNDYHGEARVEAMEGGLVLHLSRPDNAFPLTPFDCDVFTVERPLCERPQERTLPVEAGLFVAPSLTPPPERLGAG